MAALTSERDTVEIANGGRLLRLPVKGSTTIYQGSLVALDGDGYAVPGSPEEGLTAVGRAEETVENKGEEGDVSISVLRGVFWFDNTSVTTDQVTAAHVLKPCYMEDDQTVTAASGLGNVAGLVGAVGQQGVAVEIG